MMEETLSQLLQLDFLAEEPKTISATDAVTILNEKSKACFLAMVYAQCLAMELLPMLQRALITSNYARMPI